MKKNNPTTSTPSTGRGPINVTITGATGSGKTVLMILIARMLEARGYMVRAEDYGLLINYTDGPEPKTGTSIPVDIQITHHTAPAENAIHYRKKYADSAICGSTCGHNSTDANAITCVICLRKLAEEKEGCWRAALDELAVKDRAITEGLAKNAELIANWKAAQAESACMRRALKAAGAAIFEITGGGKNP